VGAGGCGFLWECICVQVGDGCRWAAGWLVGGWVGEWVGTEVIAISAGVFGGGCSWVR
jgi:hypothetical protein